MYVSLKNKKMLLYIRPVSILIFVQFYVRFFYFATVVGDRENVICLAFNLLNLILRRVLIEAFNFLGISTCMFLLHSYNSRNTIISSK